MTSGVGLRDLLQVHLQDYVTTRSNITVVEATAVQALGWAFAFAGAAVLVLYNAYQARQFLGFLVPPIVYLLFACHWVAHSFHAFRLHSYLDDVVVPKIQEIANLAGSGASKEVKEVLAWTDYYGQVVGLSTTASGDTHAFLWSRLR